MQTRGPKPGVMRWEATLVGTQQAVEPGWAGSGPSLSSRVAHCSTSRLPGGCGGPGGLKLSTSW